jgi:hypothetical protein
VVSGAAGGQPVRDLDRAEAIHHVPVVEEMLAMAMIDGHRPGQVTRPGR